MHKCFALLIIWSLYSTPIYAESIIGKTVPPLPAGLESKNGACIAQSLGFARACDFSVSDLRYPGKEPHAIVVKKKIALRGDKPVWKITDQIEYPTLIKGEFLLFSSCKLDGETDYRILAVVKEEEGAWLKASKWAGMVDLRDGRFSEISPDNIECENAWWGI